jgi:hypothetical protein
MDPNSNDVLSLNGETAPNPFEEGSPSSTAPASTSAPAPEPSSDPLSLNAESAPNPFEDSSTPPVSTVGTRTGKTPTPGILGGVSDALEEVADQPKTSYAAATEAGLANIAQGAVQGVQGGINSIKGVFGLIKPPQDDTEKAVEEGGGRHALAAYRLGQSLISGGSKAASAIANLPSNTVEGTKELLKSPDPVGTALSVLEKPTGHAAGQAALAAAGAGATAGAAKLVNATKSLIDIPDALEGDYVADLNNVAQREGLGELDATDARGVTKELQQKFQARAKAGYAKVDEAVGGNLKPVQQKIYDLEDRIAANEKVNPGQAAKDTEELAVQRGELKALVEQAKNNGVPDAEDVMKAADADYKRGTLGKSAIKMNRLVKTATPAADVAPGKVNVSSMRSMANQLERSGELDKLLGPDGAKDVLETVNTALKRTQIRKGALTVAASAPVVAGGVHLYNKLSK